MNKRNWGRCIYAAAMAFLISVSSLTCLLTTFELRASIDTVLWWAMVCSIVFSVAYTVRWQLLPVGILALAAGFLWQSGAFSESFGGLTYRLSTAYDEIYGWGVIGQKSSVDLALCTAGTVIAFYVSRAVSGGRRGFWAVFFAVVPLVPAFLVSEASPQPLWLGIWLFGVGLLIMSQSIQAKKHIGLIALPLAVLSLILLLVLPQSAQEKPRQMAHEVTSFLEELGIGAASGKPLKSDGGAVELQKLGSRKESEDLVMTVTSDRGGTLYLRGCAYDTYFRNNWTNLALQEELYWPDEALLEPAGQVTVETTYALNMMFFPYYATGGELESVNRGINNYSRVLSYSYQMAVLPQLPDTYTYEPDHGYTQLPTVTVRWASKKVQELITADMTDQEKIQAITAYVRSCAKYSLYVDKMPEEERDFAQWFAESAGKGYCVHFATTAAVLLRAAGIPTRYVTGYMVQTQAGVPAEVYGKDAHAWAECFLDGVGWIPVEATPGSYLQSPEQIAPEVVEKPEQQPRKYGLYIAVGAFALLFAATLIQWAVRVLLRRRKRKKGDPAKRLLAGYGQLSQLLELIGKKPEEKLHAAAEKAKYSPHPVAPEALQEQEKTIKKAKKALRHLPLHKKLKYRLIKGLY